VKVTEWSSSLYRFAHKDSKKISLYFCEFSINFYEFWKFKTISEIFKQLTKVEIEKDFTGHWADSSPQATAQQTGGPRHWQARKVVADLSSVRARSGTGHRSLAQAATRLPVANRRPRCMVLGGTSTPRLWRTRRARAWQWGAHQRSSLTRKRLVNTGAAAFDDGGWLTMVGGYPASSWSSIIESRK
jgi:hypothetical protein